MKSFLFGEILQGLTGTWAIVAGVVGGIMLITGLMGFCGLYKVFGMSTCPMKKAE